MPSITAHDALAMQKAGVPLIDIREPGETLLGHVPDALLLSKSQIQRNASLLPNSQHLILLCQSGKRSQDLMVSLSQSFPALRLDSVQGGCNAWRTHGLPWQEPNDFTSSELGRYARQMILPNFGLSAQRKLKAAKILLIGAGGLGSPAALYLAAAGVGQIHIADGDQVELSNLHRQVLHRQHSIGSNKAQSACAQLQALNPDIAVHAWPAIDLHNVDQALSQVDLVLDGSDNFATRFLLADAAVKHGKAYVYGAVLRFEGQLSVFYPQAGDMQTPCYRCLFAEPPDLDSAPNCAEAGVLGVLPGIIGCLQAGEALKLITGIGKPLVGELLLFNALDLQFRKIKLPRDPHCSVCAPGAEIAYQTYQQHCLS